MAFAILELLHLLALYLDELFVEGSARVAVQTVAGDGDTQTFTLTVPIDGGAPLELCIDIQGARANTPIRVVCTSVTGPAGPPVGSVDAACI